MDFERDLKNLQESENKIKSPEFNLAQFDMILNSDFKKKVMEIVDWIDDKINAKKFKVDQELQRIVIESDETSELIFTETELAAAREVFNKRGLLFQYYEDRGLYNFIFKRLNDKEDRG